MRTAGGGAARGRTRRDQRSNFGRDPRRNRRDVPQGQTVGVSCALRPLRLFGEARTPSPSARCSTPSVRSALSPTSPGSGRYALSPLALVSSPPLSAASSATAGAASPLPAPTAPTATAEEGQPELEPELAATGEEASPLSRLSLLGSGINGPGDSASAAAVRALSSPTPRVAWWRGLHVWQRGSLSRPCPSPGFQESERGASLFGGGTVSACGHFESGGFSILGHNDSSCSYAESWDCEASLLESGTGSIPLELQPEFGTSAELGASETLPTTAPRSIDRALPSVHVLRAKRTRCEQAEWLRQKRSQKRTPRQLPGYLPCASDRDSFIVASTCTPRAGVWMKTLRTVSKNPDEWWQDRKHHERQKSFALQKLGVSQRCWRQRHDRWARRKTTKSFEEQDAERTDETADRGVSDVDDSDSSQAMSEASKGTFRRRPRNLSLLSNEERTPRSSVRNIDEDRASRASSSSRSGASSRSLSDAERTSTPRNRRRTPSQCSSRAGSRLGGSKKSERSSGSASQRSPSSGDPNDRSHFGSARSSIESSKSCGGPGASSPAHSVLSRARTASIEAAMIPEEEEDDLLVKNRVPARVRGGVVDFWQEWRKLLPLEALDDCALVYERSRTNAEGLRVVLLGEFNALIRRILGHAPEAVNAEAVQYGLISSVRNGAALEGLKRLGLFRPKAEKDQQMAFTSLMQFFDFVRSVCNRIYTDYPERLWTEEKLELSRNVFRRYSKPDSGRLPMDKLFSALARLGFDCLPVGTTEQQTFVVNLTKEVMDTRGKVARNEMSSLDLQDFLRLLSQGLIAKGTEERLNDLLSERKVQQETGWGPLEIEDLREMYRGFLLLRREGDNVARFERFLGFCDLRAPTAEEQKKLEGIVKMHSPRGDPDFVAFLRCMKDISAEKISDLSLTPDSDLLPADARDLESDQQQARLDAKSGFVAAILRDERNQRRAAAAAEPPAHATVEKEALLQVPLSQAEKQAASRRTSAVSWSSEDQQKRPRSIRDSGGRVAGGGSGSSSKSKGHSHSARSSGKQSLQRGRGAKQGASDAGSTSRSGSRSRTGSCGSQPRSLQSSRGNSPARQEEEHRTPVVLKGLPPMDSLLAGRNYRACSLDGTVDEVTQSAALAASLAAVASDQAAPGRPSRREKAPQTVPNSEMLMADALEQLARDLETAEESTTQRFERLDREFNLGSEGPQPRDSSDISVGFPRSRESAESRGTFGPRSRESGEAHAATSGHASRGASGAGGAVTHGAGGGDSGGSTFQREESRERGAKAQHHHQKGEFPKGSPRPQSGRRAAIACVYGQSSSGRGGPGGVRSDSGASVDGQRNGGGGRRSRPQSSHSQRSSGGRTPRSSGRSQRDSGGRQSEKRNLDG
eukprot:TRINITY_DN7962_c0_g4_i1.p1 TRINITY_DN7962_c0_g4~~TRINITY_DN7962_c0_g4_i1.p1  ORF type:complete len:1374 (-),score=203.04 TRINITY_DN7962_c0_g4_i1:352-4473(-)